MDFKMDSTYRGSEEYKTFVEAIRKENPYMPLPLIETAIIAHKQDPQAYKKDKDYKKVMATEIKPPENKGEVVIKDAIKIGDLTEDIIKQREEWVKKYQPEPSATVEEVEA